MQAIICGLYINLVGNTISKSSFFQFLIFPIRPQWLTWAYADRLLQRLQKQLEVAQENFRADVRATARREREQVILNTSRIMYLQIVRGK